MLFRGAAIFFVLIVATSVLVDLSTAEFGTVDFFQKHGFFFLVFITFFPRLTLLFSSVPFGGIIWWLGFFFCPRVLVAGLATFAYFHTNPILVVISWIVALGGETMEKSKLNAGRSSFVFRTYRAGPQHRYENTQEAPTQTVIDKDGAIEAEFRKE